jgi:hypothetical protein
MEIVDGVPGEYLEAAAKSMGSGQRHESGKQVRSVGRQMARISIEPRWARYCDFTAGRVPEFLLKMANDSS